MYCKCCTSAVPEGHDYKLVNEELHKEEEMVCHICKLISHEPTKVSCCGHIFCNAYITYHCKKKQNPFCPLCNKPFKLMVDKLLEHKINAVEVHCSNQDKGCEWTGDMKCIMN